MDATQTFSSPRRRNLFLNLAVAANAVLLGVLVLGQGGASPRGLEASAMAAFPSRDRDAFMAHWQRILQDPTACNRTIVVAGEVAGHVGAWVQDGQREAMLQAIDERLLVRATLMRGTIHLFSAADALPFGIGAIVAFVTALLAVRGFIRFVSTHSFAAFAWYRILFGLVVLFVAW